MTTKTTFKSKLAKGALGTVAAGAMAFASASPALADDHRHRDRGGIGAGEIIAGAVVIGGIAALAGAFDGDRDRDRWRCVRAAERQARRFGGWRFADVTQIRDVDRTRYGFRVKGRMEVQGNYNFRRNFDRGRFTCRLDGRGRPRIDFDGIRGLR